MEENYLYRGLRPDEIEKGLLLPKKLGLGLFAQEALTPIKTPFTTGKNLDNAIRSHQKWKHGHPPTSGVSTTTDLKAAVGYATHKGAHDGTIAFIKRNILAQCGIQETDTAQNHECLFPKDQEIILFDNVGNAMPKEIIDRFISVKLTEWEAS
ncbi:MAG: hypothetical protein AUJ72_03190 [Candidatus Omnitrophica bacterium CG1_02_46_14]|nr:MAG: hypothetical protein AUJ72_03190 [Candidatus Omnitrophica bacterium CG1_02_46_14]